MQHGALTNSVFEQSFSFADGYLPFNRLHDGTVHDW